MSASPTVGATPALQPTDWLVGHPRTHTCGDLRASHIGQTVTLMGWVQSYRDHGGLVFIDLRDRYGLTQLVFDPTINATAHGLADTCRNEWVIGVTGLVRSRGSQINPKMVTGEIEVACDDLHIFTRSEPVPFAIEDDLDTQEMTRLKYRYLDLRRRPIQDRLIKRHRFNQAVRRYFDEAGFLELETPVLTKSTPEGARDYLVPSRLNPGNFYALPQSPQIFKQLFMVAGFDRYFQIVKCFRDEDLRADRQPEFTQIDVEMSFPTEDLIYGHIEQMMAQTVAAVTGGQIATPFPRITHKESMARYGNDKPDIRFGLPLHDITDIAGESEFQVFKDALAKGHIVKAINAEGTGEWSRKQVEDSHQAAFAHGAKGVAWVKVKDDGDWQGTPAKFFPEGFRAKLTERLGLKPGDIAMFVADRPKVANAALAQLRLYLGDKLNLIDRSKLAFLWVVDFPMFEYDDDSKTWQPAHHPFTSPRPEDIEKLENDKANCYARCYDLVLNGFEIASGSIRIHNPDVQKRVFTSLGMSEEEIRAKFGFLIDAFKFGPPPHGGIALGVDRIVMLLTGGTSIRDVIPFPKTQKGTCVMTDAPSEVSDAQLAELSIRLAPRVEA
jgi:aspartyl-tRNA synthetase